MKRMIIAISRNGISVTYKCYKLPGYGWRCQARDDGHICMRCKYCKAEMTAYNATKLLESYNKHNGPPAK